MYRILLGAALCALALNATAEFADYRFIPPAKALSSEQANAVAAGATSALRANAVPSYQIDDFAGQTEALKSAVETPALQVGSGAMLGWASADLFEAQGTQDGLNIWRASVASVDASALRLRVNLARLHPDDEVWVIDLAAPHAFGPFTLANTSSNGRWLPTTMGDTVVVELRSPRAVMPDITLEMLSHYFSSPATKQLDCPLSADCSDSTPLQEVSTGIGRMTVTDEDGTSFLCSGALLNNQITDAAEGLFLTADHCFQGTNDTIFADGVEVIWDLRTNGCPGSEPSDGTIAGLPRSTGTAFLRNSTALDGMLLRLDIVPVGTRGRAYLGWDTRAPRIGDGAVGLHHPDGTAMKESIGRVNEINLDTRFGDLQTTLSWDEGLTEGGSSGSPVMFDDSNFRVFGMLSNGNFQACGISNARLDQYSSFREFFALAGGFLNLATPPDDGSDFYERNGSPRGAGSSGCDFEAQSVEKASGNILVSGLALLTLLGMGALGRNRA